MKTAPSQQSKITPQLIKSDFRLVGLSRPRSATLTFLHTDKETFWATVDMPQDRFDAMFKWVEGNWDVKKIAEVEHEGFYEDGTPRKPIMKAVREWDL